LPVKEQIRGRSFYYIISVGHLRFITLDAPFAKEKTIFLERG